MARTRDGKRLRLVRPFCCWDLAAEEGAHYSIAEEPHQNRKVCGSRVPYLGARPVPRMNDGKAKACSTAVSRVGTAHYTQSRRRRLT